MTDRADHDTVGRERPEGAAGQQHTAGEEAWHALGVENVLDRFDVDPERGLSADEADRRLSDHGPNKLEESGGRPWWQTLLDQFRSPLIYILLIAAVVTLVLQEYIDAVVIVAVLILNAATGFYQERRP